MRGRECIFVMFSLLTLASILESNQAYALYAHPSHWMRQPKNNRFRSGIMATPEPLTRPPPEQKGTRLEFFKVSFLMENDIFLDKLDEVNSKRLKLIQLRILKRLMQLRTQDPLFAKIWNTFEQIEAKKDELSRLVPI